MGRLRTRARSSWRGGWRPPGKRLRPAPGQASWGRAQGPPPPHAHLWAWMRVLKPSPSLQLREKSVMSTLHTVGVRQMGTPTGHTSL